MSRKWQKILGRVVQNSGTKRGDTLIEVMFAIAVFSMVAVISISMMNAGVSSGERSLELVTARNELNGQAEALRFIHSSYVSELTLPTCDSQEVKNNPGEKCQQFASLWKKIVDNAMAPRTEGAAMSDDFSMPEGILGSCKDYYNPVGSNLLTKNRAFVLNTRKIGKDKLNASTNENELSENVYISISEHPEAFREPTLGARLIYTKDASSGEDNNSVNNLSSSQLFDYLKYAEGIWVVAVGGKYDSTHTKYDFYDFYIQTCWFGSNSNAPTSIDSVIRLYNPEAKDA